MSHDQVKESQEAAVIPDYGAMAYSPKYSSFLTTIGPLACDMYALTMTCAAWKNEFVDKTISTSHVFCRSLLNNGDTYKDSETDDIKPTKIPYLINGGLGLVAEWYSGWKWKQDDLVFLAKLTTPNGKGGLDRVFPDAFLYWLSKQKLTLDIKAIPEGELIFPREPSMQITGPWWQQMMVEASTLELISSSTNLTTAATQVRLAASRLAREEGAQLRAASTSEAAYIRQDASLAEMALRRSDSIGALQSARAAAIARWDNTSNLYAARCFGISAMGTFAHAWVMLHDTEEEAFENWAKAFPNSTVFLVDTYNTVHGIKTAIKVCKKYGLVLKGIRLDSGNMAYLSQEARALLDEAGYRNAAILATDSISTKAAASLFGRVATEVADRSSYITGFGIGSEVAVNRNNPLLDFVMKLGAVYRKLPNGEILMREVIKLAETPKKTTLPGVLEVIRYMDKHGRWRGDTIIPAEFDPGQGVLKGDLVSVHTETQREKVFPAGTAFVRVLQPWMKGGQWVEGPYQDQDPAAILRASRETCARTLGKLDPYHLLLPPDMPHHYGVGIARPLLDKQKTSRERLLAKNGM